MRDLSLLIILAALAPAAGCRTTPAQPTSVAQEGDAAATPSATRTAAATGDDNRLRWCVFGEVRDQAGRPLADVEVTAYCGAGTLRRTGVTTTDATGAYTLQFGPGMLFMEDHSGLQAATIAPHKSGWIEQNLHRQGDLRMANRPPDESELASWGGPGMTVLPGEPRRVDFVMIPAGTIRGRLVDADGQPIVDHYVSLDAEELPPSSSVLATVKTDADGRFSFTEVPAASVWLATRSPQERMVEVVTPRLTCDAGRTVEVDLVFRPGPPPELITKPVVAGP